MKICTTFILLLFSINSFSQTRLDQKNGFKDFHLGDSYSKWESTVMPMSVNTLSDYLIKDHPVHYDGILDHLNVSSWKRLSTYYYVGNCCETIFHYSIDKIILQFDSNRLVRIILVTDFLQKGTGSIWSTSVFFPFNRLLVDEFGSAKSNGPSGGYDTYVWTGQKVLLKSIYYHIATAVGSRQIVIVETYDGGF